MMEPSPLTDKNVFPSQEVIFSHIGKSKALWLAFFEQMHKDHPDFVEEWRYYNDGKRWLMKATRKKKTVFWLSIIPKAFRITFYFSEKATELISLLCPFKVFSSRPVLVLQSFKVLSAPPDKINSPSGE